MYCDLRQKLGKVDYFGTLREEIEGLGWGLVLCVQMRAVCGNEGVV